MVIMSMSLSWSLPSSGSINFPLLLIAVAPSVCCHWTFAVISLPGPLSSVSQTMKISTAISFQLILPNLHRKIWRSSTTFKPCLFWFLCIPCTVYCPLDSPGYRRGEKGGRGGQGRGKEEEGRGETQRQCCCLC